MRFTPSASSFSATFLGLSAFGLALASCALDPNGTFEPPSNNNSTSVGGSGGGATSSSASGTGGASAGTGGAGGAGGTSGSGGMGAGQGGATSSSSSSSSSGQGGQGGMMPPDPVCGDGKIEGTEQCDDKNTTSADGCGSDCKNEDPNICNGVTIKMNKGDIVTTNGDTTNTSDKADSVPKIEYCNGGTASGNDLVYAVVPQVNGTLVATMDAAYGNHWLHIHTDCPGTASTTVGCDYSSMSNTNDVSTVQVTMGTTYYVFCDGYQGGRGKFTLTLEMQ